MAYMWPNSNIFAWCVSKHQFLIRGPIWEIHWCHAMHLHKPSCCHFRAYIMQKGCACKFLHGPGTDQDKIVEIEKALEAKTELQAEIQFYRKNGNKWVLSKFQWKTIICILNLSSKNQKRLIFLLRMILQLFVSQ